MMCASIAACLLYAANFSANTYGYSENFCQKNGVTHPCTKGLKTATGDTFDPKKPTLGVWLPPNLHLKPQWVWLRLKDSKVCAKLWLNDRKGRKGFDLTPGALIALGVRPSRTWSGKLVGCIPTVVAIP